MDETDFDMFEAEYAAELDALMGEEDDDQASSKRSLKFTSPNAAPQNLNDSISQMQPLPDDSENNNGSESEKPADDLNDVVIEGRRKKRTGPSIVGQEAKRQRTDDVVVQPARQLAQELNELLADYDLRRERVGRRIPAGDYVPISSSDGRRYYMGVNKSCDRIAKSENACKAANSMSLLSVPYYQLKDEVLEKRRQRLVEATTVREPEVEEMEDDETDGLVESISALWVDRYSPRGYTDLLSDESINRTMLHWLKQWDHVVFGREIKKKDKAPKNKDSAPKWANKYRDAQTQQTEQAMELDALNRPFHKIAMLCGPPGLGKTTLAHVLANHAGYKVTEINASDDRSAEVFQNKMDAAVQMQAVIGTDTRPNCLVIDEIDGAPQPAINRLLALITAGAEGDTGKKKKSTALMRPIICICNDQYAPSLRQLRAHAFLLKVPPTMPIKLTSRLSHICNREGLKADQNTLLALCNKSENDIRSCINALQFFRGKKADLMLRDIQTTTFAQKDIHKSLFSVWQSIFQKPRQSKRYYVNPFERTTMSLQEMTRLQSLQNKTSGSARFHDIYMLACATGEYEKVIQGVYDNYLGQNVRDPRMKGVNTAVNWLCHVDMMTARVMRTQDYSTYRYTPFLMVVFHLLFASSQVSKLSFPRGDSDYRQKLSTSSALVSSLMSEMDTSVRHHLNQLSVVMDVLPPLMDVIQPSFRPINTQLYSAREKADLNQLVRIMVEYNMTYRQEKVQDGQYMYVLEPPVDQLVKFPGLKQKRQMTYAAKQLVAREINMEKMRRAEKPLANMTAPKPSQEKKQSAQKTDEVANHRKTLQAKSIDEKDLVSRDFFGRELTSTVEQQRSTSAQKKSHDDGSALLSRDVWYHFKEGYSNAVRKTVRIQDMI